VPNVKGNVLASRISWVSLTHGLAGLDRLAAVASPTLAKLILRGATMSTWYPFELFTELTLLIDSTFGKGDLELIRLMGRNGSDANLTTIYRLFYKVGTVHWMLGRSARLWGAHYDSGRLETYARGFRHVELRIVDFPTPHRAHCISVAGWVERSIELSGGRNVQVNEPNCRAESGSGVDAQSDNSCRMHCTWE
jgi:hypothetical protein